MTFAGGACVIRIQHTREGPASRQLRAETGERVRKILEEWQADVRSAEFDWKLV